MSSSALLQQFQQLQQLQSEAQHAALQKVRLENQKLVAEIIRYPGGYLRFSGPVVLDRYEGGKIVEHYEAPGSFEQCYWQRDIHGER